MTKFIYVGEHPRVLASSQPLAPGQEVQLDAKELERPHNKRLVERGLLHLVTEKPRSKSEPKNKPAKEDS